MRTAIEIGAHVPAMLIGGDLDGVFVNVRLGLNGLPRFLVFPKMQLEPPKWIEDVLDHYDVACRQREFIEDRYRLYDDVPCKYLHESEWKDDGDDDDGPNENAPTPAPGILAC